MSELTTFQAARRLNVGVSTVRLWCQQARFPNARAEDTPRGVVWLIPEGDLNGFVKPKRGAPPKAKDNGTATKPAAEAKARAARVIKKGGKK